MSAAPLLLLRDGDLSATIALRGAELKSLKLGHTDFIWHGEPAWWSFSAPLLFPIIGRLREGQIGHAGCTLHLPPHGFARTSAFAIVMTIGVKRNTNSLR